LRGNALPVHQKNQFWLFSYCFLLQEAYRVAKDASEDDDYMEYMMGKLPASGDDDKGLSK